MTRHKAFIYDLALVALLCLVACQDINAQKAQNRAAALTRADVEALSAQSDLRIDWNWFYGALNATPREDREALLKLLIASPREDLASEAAGYGIRQGDAGLAGAIASQIVGWSAGSQSGVLGSVINTRPIMLEIPRALVQAALSGDQSAHVDGGDPPVDAVGLAALLLETFGSGSDRNMLSKLVVRQPGSTGLWLALADAGVTTPELTQLGSATYQDQHINLLARVAAASALEPVDGRAAEFAFSQLQLFLTRLQHEGAAEMLPQVFQPNAAGKEVDDFVYWSKYATILRTLMVLKGSAIGPLVLKNLDSANEHIRIVCAAVAAIRWPEQLLQISQGRFSDREYAGLMAAVAIRHPELASRAQGRTTPTQFEDAKAQIAKSGTFAISPFAGTLQVFWK
jgi:hypothetical protein